MFKNEVIDRYMHCIMQNLNKNAQACIYSLSYLNIDHFVELIFLKGKLGKLLLRNPFSCLVIQGNELSKLRERITFWENDSSNFRERIINPWERISIARERIAQLICQLKKNYFCSFRAAFVGNSWRFMEVHSNAT